VIYVLLAITVSSRD